MISKNFWWTNKIINNIFLQPLIILLIGSSRLFLYHNIDLKCWFKSTSVRWQTFFYFMFSQLGIWNKRSFTWQSANVHASSYTVVQNGFALILLNGSFAAGSAARQIARSCCIFSTPETYYRLCLIWCTAIDQLLLMKWTALTSDGGNLSDLEAVAPRAILLTPRTSRTRSQENHITINTRFFLNIWRGVFTRLWISRSRQINKFSK